MRVVIPLAGLMLAACAPTTPLDLIPREDLLMMEAADRLERQNPMAIRTPAQPRDINAEYHAALRAAGVEPFQPLAPDISDMPPDSPKVAPARRVATRPSPVATSAIPSPAPQREPDSEIAAASPADPLPVDPPIPAPSPISVDEMLARVRAQSQKQPEG